MNSEGLPKFRSLSAADLSRVGLSDAGKEALRNIDEIVVFSVPLNIRFRGVNHREGLLLRGPWGWGECAPFWDYDPRVSARWLRSGLEQATTPLPITNRSTVPINITIPVCDMDEVRRRIGAHPGCFTAKVKVADDPQLTENDIERVALTSRLLADVHGEKAAVRIDANRAWSVSEAVEALEILDAAAMPTGGLQYAEQPVESVEDMAALRQLTSVPVAADESIRLSDSPLEVRNQDAADVAVLKVSPLGGIYPALNLASKLGLPSVVSSALDTSIGLASGVILAAALPELSFACGLGTASILAADVIEDSLNPTSPNWAGPKGAIAVEDAILALNAPLTSRARNLEQETTDRWLLRLSQMSHFVSDPLPGHGDTASRKDA